MAGPKRQWGFLIDCLWVGVVVILATILCMVSWLGGCGVRGLF